MAITNIIEAINSNFSTRRANLEKLMEHLSSEENSFAVMVKDHERLVEALAAEEELLAHNVEVRDAFQKQKDTFFTKVDTSKKVSFDALEGEYKQLEKDLIAAKKVVTKSANKVTTLKAELSNAEGKITALAPVEPKKETTPITKSVNNSKTKYGLDATGRGVIKLRTQQDKRGSGVWEAHPFETYGDCSVFLQRENDRYTGIVTSFWEAVKRGEILPNKTYLCRVVQDAKGNLHIHAIFDNKGKEIASSKPKEEAIILPVTEDAAATHIIPSVKEVVYSCGCEEKGMSAMEIAMKAALARHAAN